MTNTTTTTGVATLKKLQKECLTIDLTKLRFKKGYRSYRDDFDPNAPLSTDDVNTNEEGMNPHIKFGGDGSRNGIYERPFINHSSGKWDIDHRTNRTLYRNLKVLMFQGGKRGRGGYVHNDFTDAQILTNKSTDEILGVLYALDNDFLNEWLRQTIDPNIPNNYEELHADKEFEVLITTTTYSQEKVKVVGRTYDEAREKVKKTDPMLDTRGYYSGMKTTSPKESEKPIPSSYEEWVSLNEKEVA